MFCDPVDASEVDAMPGVEQGMLEPHPHLPGFSRSYSAFAVPKIRYLKSRFAEVYLGNEYTKPAVTPLTDAFIADTTSKPENTSTIMSQNTKEGAEMMCNANSLFCDEFDGFHGEDVGDAEQGMIRSTVKPSRFMCFKVRRADLLKAA